MLSLGFMVRQQKRGGSHYVFKHPSVATIVVLVTHGKNDILPEYQVQKALRAMEKLKSAEGKEERRQ